MNLSEVVAVAERGGRVRWPDRSVSKLEIVDSHVTLRIASVHEDGVRELQIRSNYPCEEVKD